MSDYATEGGHWYDRHANPCYEVPDRQRRVKCPACTGNRKSAAGKAAVAACETCDAEGYVYPYSKPATLRDARPNNWCRGVTSILNAKASPGLERYRLRQLAEAAYTAPADIAGLPFDEWLARVQADAAEHAKVARDVGTAIHGVAERGIRGETLEGYTHVAWFAPLRAEIERTLGFWPEFLAEHSFVHRWGYGCKLDAISLNPAIIIDFKTSEWEDDEPPSKLYDEHAAQLAAQALAAGLWPHARLFVGYGDRKQPRWSLRELTGDEADRGLEIFRLCLELTRITEGYVPDWADKVLSYDFEEAA
jgi:hypothetical protein